MVALWLILTACQGPDDCEADQSYSLVFRQCVRAPPEPEPAPEPEPEPVNDTSSADDTAIDL